jgi:hypothetical protein
MAGSPGFKDTSNRFKGKDRPSPLALNDPQEPSADNMAFAIHLETKPLRLLPFVQRENVSERPNVPGRPSHTR